MGILILTGIISAIFAFNSIIVFGSFDLALVKHSADFINSVRGVHEFCTNSIIALLTIHIFEAFYHH